MSSWLTVAFPKMEIVFNYVTFCKKMSLLRAQ